MNHQNPASRLLFFADATSHAATSVTAMAGHCTESSSASRFTRSSAPVVRALERRKVELAHLQHRGERTLRLLIGLRKPVGHLYGYDLPRQAVLVLEPAAHV